MSGTNWEKGVRAYSCLDYFNTVMKSYWDCSFHAFCLIVTQNTMLRRTLLMLLTVIEKGSCPAAEQYAKSGCPSGLRRHIWSLILDVRDNEQVIRLT